jgi:hypothetical protein
MWLTSPCLIWSDVPQYACVRVAKKIAHSGLRSGCDCVLVYPRCGEAARCSCSVARRGWWASPGKDHLIASSELLVLAKSIAACWVGNTKVNL